MDFDPARGFAPHPGDAGGGGAIDSFAPAHSASRLAHLCRGRPSRSIHQVRWALQIEQKHYALEEIAELLPSLAPLSSWWRA